MRPVDLPMKESKSMCTTTCWFCSTGSSSTSNSKEEKTDSLTGRLAKHGSDALATAANDDKSLLTCKCITSRRTARASVSMPAISSSVSSFRTAARLASRANFLNISSIRAVSAIGSASSSRLSSKPNCFKRSAAMLFTMYNIRSIGCTSNRSRVWLRIKETISISAMMKHIKAMSWADSICCGFVKSKKIDGSGSIWQAARWTMQLSTEILKTWEIRTGADPDTKDAPLTVIVEFSSTTSSPNPSSRKGL
mmetsp:Transcript_13105/g.31172  ORF Transcript_13105/g.31172 Transcript_13105/m.31172 type:complete len:251 (-) Transcript_13105:1259-2011(-)